MKTILMAVTLLIATNASANECVLLKENVEITRETGDRQLYTHAKREYLACENTRHSIHNMTGYDIKTYMIQHELNDEEIMIPVPVELQGDRYGH